jgi:hypothetical protein
MLAIFSKLTNHRHLIMEEKMNQRAVIRITQIETYHGTSLLHVDGIDINGHADRFS